MGGFDYDKYKIDEQYYGIGKPEELEFKIVRDKIYRTYYYEGEVKKGTTIKEGRGLCITT